MLKLQRPSPGMGVALVALFVALGAAASATVIAGGVLRRGGSDG